MANTITRTIKEKTKRRAVVVATIASDGTPAAATDVILVQKSDLIGPSGVVPGRLVIDRIEYACQQFPVTLEFDHTTDDLIMNVAGTGYIDFCKNYRFQGFIDPASAGGTGDIVGTVDVADIAANEEVSIVFYLRLKD